MVDAWNISMFFMYSLSSSIRFFISIGIGFVIVFGFFYSFDKSWYKKYPHPNKPTYWQSVKMEPKLHLIWWAIVSVFIVFPILESISWLGLVIYPNK